MPRITRVPSTKYIVGRNGFTATYIYIHCLNTTIEEQDAIACRPGGRSFHYFVDKGTVHQYINVADTAKSFVTQVPLAYTPPTPVPTNDEITINIGIPAIPSDSDSCIIEWSDSLIEAVATAVCAASRDSGIPVGLLTVLFGSECQDAPVTEIINLALECLLPETPIGNITNLLSSSANIMTSSVNSIVSNAPIVNSISGSIAGSDLTVTVNGVSSAPIPIPLSGSITNVLSSFANTITSTVNGITATAPAVNTVAVSVASGNITVTVNGVASTPVALPTIPATTNTLVNASNTITSTVNGVVASATVVQSVSATIGSGNLTVTVNGISSIVALPTVAATTNVLSRVVNTITSTVDGVASNTTVIGTVVGSVSGGALTITINGISSSAIPMSQWDLLGNSGTNPTTNYIGTSDSQDLVVATNATPRIRILAAGNVGVNTASPVSGFQVSTSFGLPIRKTAVAATLNATDFTLIYTGATAATITLPTPVGITGRIYAIKRSATAGTVTIVPTAGSIDGGANAILASDNASIMIQSDGSDWYIISF